MSGGGGPAAARVRPPARPVVRVLGTGPDPADLPGLLLWLEPSFGLDRGAGGVAGLKSLGGLARRLSQADPAAQPALALDGPAGRAALHGDGTAARLADDDFAALGAYRDFTVLAAVRQDNDPALRRGLLGFGSNGLRTGFDLNTFAGSYRFSIAGAAGVGCGLGPGAWALCHVRKAGQTYQAGANGGGLGTVSDVGPLNLLPGFRLLHRFGPDEHATGALYACLVYGRALDNAGLDAALGYLSARTAIPVAPVIG